MAEHKRDFWVGLFVLAALGLASLFFWLMGAFSFSGGSPQFFLRFNFAGGVEVGSPVRVSGVKIGRVENIEFLSAVEGTDNAAIEVTISVAKKALGVIREDSQFFVNIAGIIGERYVEVSSGSAGSPALKVGSRIRAVDPPRIDQLLSQGYGVFGRIQDLLEQNEKSVTGFLNQLVRLMGYTSKMLERADREKIISFVEDLTAITNDLRYLTERVRGSQGNLFFENLNDLVERAQGIDGPALKKFFQDEGVRARVF